MKQLAHIRFDPVAVARLNIEAKRADISMAELVRRIVAAHLDPPAPPTPFGRTLLTGRPPLSTSLPGQPIFDDRRVVPIEDMEANLDALAKRVAERLGIPGPKEKR